MTHLISHVCLRHHQRTILPLPLLGLYSHHLSLMKKTLTLSLKNIVHGYGSVLHSKRQVGHLDGIRQGPSHLTDFVKVYLKVIHILARQVCQQHYIQNHYIRNAGSFIPCHLLIVVWQRTLISVQLKLINIFIIITTTIMREDVNRNIS